MRELRSRLLRWRTGVRWYAVALLTIPLVAAATLLPLSLLSADLRPGIVTTDGSRAALLAAGVAVGLVVGFCEEVGWTGFAIPRLRLRHDLLATGLIVGLLWGVWHLPLFWWASGDESGRLVWSTFLLSVFFCMVVLPAVRVLIVWLNDHTQSLLLAILMHATIDVVSLVLMPRDAAFGPHLAWYVVFAVALWGVAAVAMVADRRPTRQRPRPRKASDRFVPGAAGQSPA